MAGFVTVAAATQSAWVARAALLEQGAAPMRKEAEARSAWASEARSAWAAEERGRLELRAVEVRKRAEARPAVAARKGVEERLALAARKGAEARLQVAVAWARVEVRPRAVRPVRPTVRVAARPEIPAPPARAARANLVAMAAVARTMHRCCCSLHLVLSLSEDRKTPDRTGHRRGILFT